MIRIAFLIYYANEQVLLGKTLADWDFMPDDGILVIVEIFDRQYKGKYTCTRYAGYDYYWMMDADLDYVYRGQSFSWKSWDIGCKSARYIPPNGAHIKKGGLVDAATWENIYTKSLIDPVYGTLS